jgi:hypothetical protein
MCPLTWCHAKCMCRQVALPSVTHSSPRVLPASCWHPAPPPPSFFAQTPHLHGLWHVGQNMLVPASARPAASWSISSSSTLFEQRIWNRSWKERQHVVFMEWMLLNDAGDLSGWSTCRPSFLDFSIFIWRGGEVWVSCLLISLGFESGTTRLRPLMSSGAQYRCLWEAAQVLKKKICTSCTNKYGK